MWNFADDAGRLEDAPKQIKMKIFPGDDITAANVEELLRELSCIALVTRYSVENRGYIQVNGWRHQVINKPQKSKLPAPSGNATVALPVGMEGNGKEETPPAPSEDVPTVPVVVDGDRARSIDEVRKIVWRLHGLTEDQIGTRLISTSREGSAQAAEWLKAGHSVEDIRDAVSRAYDTCAEPIRRPWVYLDEVMRNLGKRDAVPDAAVHVDPMRDQWRQRLKRFTEAKVWFGHWDGRPGEPGCVCPPDILAEFGFGRTA